MKISRKYLLKILKAHGLEPAQSTAFKEGKLVKGTSFDDEMGIKEEYNLEAVKNWLGY